MTAIIICRGVDGFHIVSDGASYLDDGRFVLRTEKLRLLTPYSGFIAARGIGPALPILMFRGEGSHNSFDELLDRLPALTRDCDNQLPNAPGYWQTDQKTFSFFVGGWSESRERFESYVISPDDRESTTFELKREAFELTPLPDGFLAPGASTAALEACGLFGPDNQFTDQLSGPALPLWLHAARMGTMDGGNAYVGAFIQETFIGRAWTRSTIIYRYDDTLGEPMIPKGTELPDIKAMVEERRASWGPQAAAKAA